MIDFVRKNKLMGKTVVGLGAATKGNTLLNYCKFDYKDIYCVLDNSKYKIGKFMPGSGITIADEKAMSQERSPFRTIGTLVDYIDMLINDK